MTDQWPEVVKLTPEQERQRRRRSLAIALTLGALVIIFFITTIVRLSSNIAAN